jgi:thiol-disulfide isomerase/thioredoxin
VSIRPFLLLSAVLPLSAAVVSDVRNKISAGDLTSADAIADEFCRGSGPVPECAAAVSWLARGAFMMKDIEAASRYLTRTKSLVSDLLKNTAAEDDAFLTTAIGAAIEVEARMLASQGKRDQAVALLDTELARWKPYALRARIQKNLNMLSLEGKPAPDLDAADRGKPALLFLWGYWCGDCTAQAPIIARIKRKYEPLGLVVRAPTRRIGPLPADQEDLESEHVWKASYPGLEDVPHSVSEDLMLHYGVSSTPTLVLIDRKGIVRMYRPFRMSETELSRHIDALLQ